MISCLKKSVFSDAYDIICLYYPCSSPLKDVDITNPAYQTLQAVIHKIRSASSCL